MWLEQREQVGQTALEAPCTSWGGEGLGFELGEARRPLGVWAEGHDSTWLLGYDSRAFVSRTLEGKGDPMRDGSDCG